MLPKGWIETTFEEVTPPDAPIIYGILQPGPDSVDGIPYIRPTEITGGEIQLAFLRRTTVEIAGRYRRSALRAGDLILTIVGTIGKVAITPPELDGGNITQSSCRVRCDPELVLPSFMRYFLRSPAAFKLYDEKKLGTAVPRLNIADIRRFPIALPPLAEQHRIVAKLNTLTSHIARARTELDRVSAMGKDARALIDRLEAAILSRAFRGELVPQDPTDESANITLDRIRFERANAPKPKRGRQVKEAA